MSDTAENNYDPMAGIPAESELAGSSGDAPPITPESPSEASRPTIEKFETWSDLEAGYRELESFRGNSVRIPGPDAGADAWNEFNEKIGQVPGVVRLPEEGDAEGWANFYQRMGAPAEAAGYQFSEVPGFTGDGEDIASFAEVAHNLHLTREQADGLYQYLAGNLTEVDNSFAQEQLEGAQRLKGEWGQAFDHKFAAAQNAARMMNDKIPGIAEYFNGINPSEPFDHNLVRLMSEVADMMGETGALDMGRPAGIMTPEEAMLQAQEIRDNPEHPYNNELDPAHEAAQKKMADLYKIAYGGS
jgi:hypothetical protein